MKKDIRYIITLCIVFSLFFISNELFFSSIFYFIDGLIHLYQISFFITYSIVALPIFIFVYFTNNQRIFKPLGLKGNIIQAILISFAFSVPMLLGSGLMANFEITIEPTDFWFGCVFAAFFEELYYRGFFFGQLFKKTKLGFFPSLLISALVFASLHLYQSNDVSTLIGIFATTFLGAGLFAWLYAEWNYNLWLPIGLHFFMNLSWELFSISDNAFGDLNANLIRALTIVLAITVTLIYKKKRKIPLEVNRDTLFMKSALIVE